VPTAASRQHQHRRRNPLFPPAFQQRQTIDFRQAKVEHHGVILLRLHHEIRALAIRSAIHRVARLVERTRQLPRQHRFVFHNQYAHTPLLSYSSTRVFRPSTFDSST
jgi:hypothetical protein